MRHTNSATTVACLQPGRARVTYDNIKVRAIKFKSGAKERRKQRKRENMGMGFKDAGEEIPSFFMPQRYKLLYKVMEEGKNISRIGRKPIPKEVREELAKAAKEYNSFK